MTNLVEHEVSMYNPPDAGQRQFRQQVLDLLARPGNPLGRETVGHVTASAVVIRSTDSAVLLTLHPKYGRWLQLGGHMEPGELSARAAALREA